jgi:hypothetical protein
MCMPCLSAVVAGNDDVPIGWVTLEKPSLDLSLWLCHLCPDQAMATVDPAASKPPSLGWLCMDSQLPSNLTCEAGTLTT